MTDTDFDIGIIGGGAIGASLALALRDLPLRIALIEAVSPDLRLEEAFDARSLSLSPSSQRIFAGMGLWPSLKNHIIPIEHIHVSDKGHFWANRFHAENEGLNALGYMVELQDLNRVLYDALKASNIRYFCPGFLETLNVSDHFTTLTFRESSETVKSITVRLVVAADGSYSKVRQLRGIDHNEWDYDQSAIVANIGLARDHQNTAYERFTPKGPMVLLPLKNRRSSLVWTLPRKEVSHYINLSPHAFLAELQGYFGYRLGRFVKMGQPKEFPLKMISASEKTAKSLILISNASLTLHPVAGQGFNLGLRDVASLVSVLTEAIRKDQHISSPDVLNHFEKSRRWDRRRMLIFSDGLTRLYSQQFIAHSMLRTFCMLSVSTFPTAKELLLRHTMGLYGRLPELACGG